MRLCLDVSGILFSFEIKDYSRKNRTEYGCTWCQVNFSLVAENWLNYEIKNAEVMTAEEIDELTERLQRLLNGELREPEKVGLIEPDFILHLYPDQTNQSEPVMEWRVYFWDGERGLTANYLSLNFGKAEMEALLSYLKTVQGISLEENEICTETCEIEYSGMLSQGPETEIRSV